VKLRQQRAGADLILPLERRLLLAALADALPDLRGEYLALAGIAPGGAYIVNYGLRNDGAPIEGTVAVRFYLSDDHTISASDQFLRELSEERERGRA